MNREIKYEAYDEGNKVMHHNVQFIRTGIEGNDWIVFSSDEMPYKTEGNKIIFDNPFFSQQIKIREYIGLKNKNGKEIYEGDILKTDSGINQYVEYREDMTMFVCRISPKSASMCIQKDWEIIGNIYEHPELLK